MLQTDSVDQIHIHPRHNPDNHEFDLALLRLKKLPDLSPGNDVLLLEGHSNVCCSDLFLRGWGHKIRIGRKISSLRSPETCGGSESDKS